MASCRDCPSYLTSAETAHDLLFPPKTTVHEKWLPAETVSVILLPAERLGRKLITGTVSARSYLPSTTVSAGSKRLQTVSAEAKYDRQSLQETKISRLVYTLWKLPFIVNVGMKTVSQRCRFVTSNYREMVLSAIDFRNRFAERPYLCEELIEPDQVVVGIWIIVTLINYVFCLLHSQNIQCL